MLQNEQKKYTTTYYKSFLFLMTLPSKPGTKESWLVFHSIHQKKSDLMLTTQTTLLFLCTNAHWAAINVTSIHIINKLAASLGAFTQEHSVHNCSITGKSTH